MIAFIWATLLAATVGANTSATPSTGYHCSLVTPAGAIVRFDIRSNGASDVSSLRSIKGGNSEWVNDFGPAVEKNRYVHWQGKAKSEKVSIELDPSYPDQPSRVIEINEIGADGEGLSLAFGECAPAHQLSQPLSAATPQFDVFDRSKWLLGRCRLLTGDGRTSEFTYKIQGRQIRFEPIDANVWKSAFIVDGMYPPSPPPKGDIIRDFATFRNAEGVSGRALSIFNRANGNSTLTFKFHSIDSSGKSGAAAICSAATKMDKTK